MKKFKQFITALTIVTICVSCSDSDSFNPYTIQEKTPFYPTSLSYSNYNNNSRTNENWEFKYNADNTIKEYTYSQSITNGNRSINETHSATLNYSTDLDGNKLIKNEIETDYHSSDLTNNYQYKDYVTEWVEFDNDKIVRIESMIKRISDNKEENLYSEWEFTYSNDYCTKAEFKNQDKKTIYNFQWSGERLAKVVINNDSKSGDHSSDIHEYSYNAKSLINDYGFSPMAFVYGHLPKVYAAMGYFGKETPYLLESQRYEASIRNPNVNNGQPYPINAYTRDYSIEDSNAYIVIKIDSDTDNLSEYRFNK